MNMLKSSKMKALALGACLCFLATGCGDSAKDTTFLVRITNIDTGTNVTTSAGTTVPAVFAPGAAAVHAAGSGPFFVTGEPANPGLEIMAEDGGGDLLASEADARRGTETTYTFAVPDGADSPGPLTPGGSYSFEIVAEEGDYMSLATMFVQSNDLFVAPSPQGVPLYDASGNPRSGDITSEVVLWDAGTEVNEEPGLGPNQAPRQAGPNTGADENGVVRTLDATDFPLPPLANVMSITITPLN